MICGRCKNPTQLTFEGECEWCGYLLQRGAESGSGAVQPSCMDALRDALEEARNEVLRIPQAPRGLMGMLFGTEDEEQSNRVNRAMAHVVAHADVPADRLGLLEMIDFAESNAVATKVKWYDASELTEGQSELHKAWLALADRAKRKLGRSK